MVIRLAIATICERKPCRAEILRNGQFPPVYWLPFPKTAEAPWAAHSLHALSLEQDRISALTLIAKPTDPQLFEAFGLPPILPDTANIK